MYPLTYLHGELGPGAEYALQVQEGWQAFLVCSEGRLEVDPGASLPGRERPPAQTRAFQGAPEAQRAPFVIPSPCLVVLAPGTWNLQALEPTVFLFAAAPPLHEPIARWGPFVLSTPEELRQTLEDYHLGRLIQKPPRHTGGPGDSC